MFDTKLSVVRRIRVLNFLNQAAMARLIMLALFLWVEKNGLDGVMRGGVTHPRRLRVSR